MTSQKILCQGAEAKIILSNKFIIKDRTKKSYRLAELDEKIRKRRTKSESKLLEKASNIINTPKPFFIPDFYQIKMPFIDGKKLSEHLDNFPLAKQKQICKQIGESIAKLHDSNIIHGDLTTSNMILKDNKVYFIDFGLGFISRKFEDKAVDLHLLKSTELDPPAAKFHGKGGNKVEKLRYDEKEKRVCINQNQHFEGIKKEIWEYQVGGYQVCTKWLKDRKEKKLSLDEIKHYCKIVTSLQKTIEIQRAIDDIYREVEKRTAEFDI
ncbi:hypothetical protein ES703_101914 [subsurface metagenome]